jgi:hypothetical protein
VGATRVNPGEEPTARKTLNGAIRLPLNHNIDLVLLIEVAHFRDGPWLANFVAWPGICRLPLQAHPTVCVARSTITGSKGVVC